MNVVWPCPRFIAMVLFGELSWAMLEKSNEVSAFDQEIFFFFKGPPAVILSFMPAVQRRCGALLRGAWPLPLRPGVRTKLRLLVVMFTLPSLPTVG